MKESYAFSDIPRLKIVIKVVFSKHFASRNNCYRPS